VTDGGSEVRGEGSRIRGGGSQIGGGGPKLPRDPPNLTPGAAEFAAAAAGFCWHRRQPDLSRRAGSPAGFDRSCRKSDGGAAEGSTTY